MWPTACGVCADAGVETQTTSAPTATAINLDVCLMFPPAATGRARARYPATTVKLMSRVNDLFASLSVTLISSR